MEVVAEEAVKFLFKQNFLSLYFSLSLVFIIMLCVCHTPPIQNGPVCMSFTGMGNHDGCIACLQGYRHLLPHPDSNQGFITFGLLGRCFTNRTA